MRLGLFFYRNFSYFMSAFAGLLMHRRVRQGKENPRRLNERFAKNLSPRPNGLLIWLHAASVGESLVQVELASQLKKQELADSFLFTCQTLTGADTINAAITNSSLLSASWTLQQMAPLDLPNSARRFVDHWHPDLAVFAEGDIWPNLLKNLKRHNTRTALINARMTEKSISGWRRWPATAEHVFGHLDLLLASDLKTATGLSDISKRKVTCTGNMKSALPMPDASADDIAALKGQIGDRPILVAASTHAGEEALFLDAYMQMTPRPFAIIAPRHPERAAEIERLLSCSNLSWANRSRGEVPSIKHDILLADTIGEMGLWYRLADFVYLGGGHAPGVGGHNPLEPIRLSRPVVTGPSVFNFEESIADLIDIGAITIVADAIELKAAYPAPAPSSAILEKLESVASGPMEQTVIALAKLFETREAV
ncbi:MAG: 3-deoxy-D-manno-octulosonic acid transferase [Henriciella sp.]